MSYTVSLDIYEGPFDLLLQLVSKERLDVADISISTITEEYLRAVEQMGELDLNTATAFLLMAATLLELKSIKLLPVRQEDPGLIALLEERDHLVHRLIEYSTFKQAALSISSTIELNRNYFYRPGGVPEELEVTAPDPFAGVTAEQLAAAAARVLAPKPGGLVDLTHVTPIRITVGEMVRAMAGELRRSGIISFRDLTRSSSRIEVIVKFLALLELYKSQSVELEQAAPFSEIVVRWRSPAASRSGTVETSEWEKDADSEETT